MRYLQTFCVVILCITFSLTAYSQQILGDNYQRPSYSYRSENNPHYWKNRKPYDGYWQQDVEYSIKARIDEKTDVISGDVTLTYYNNSPDALPFVYFHLYQEAFQPDSYVSDLNEANDEKPTFGPYEAAGKGCDVSTVTVTARNGRNVTETTILEQDFTVLKVTLQQPIQPGSNITFRIPFDTYFDTGSLRRRMKKFKSGEFMHYDGVHWYPRICVYDRKMGWDTDQHLGKEFYGDYGSYAVELDFASNYIVEGSGWLENEAEVMPASLREKLDIKNFKGKPWESPASVIIPYTEGDRKIWKYYAMNVHDFAFTADPNYRIGEASVVVNGQQIRCIALAQESHAGFWQNAAEYAATTIKTFSDDFTPYIWPKIIVADARDGMEYPMLTLDGGYDPSYRDLFVHEIGHMWYFGMVGNNETYRAFMDEGFTQFITSWGMRKIDGDYYIKFPEPNKYRARFKNPDPVMMGEVLYAYIEDASRKKDAPLNTHSDAFNSALGHGGGYRHVYFKTATMLWNLQYVLGDELFLQAMQHYTEKWKLCHPYPEDFRNSIIEYTHVDLNWFFDQWLETTKNIDYGICKVDKEASVNIDGQQLQSYAVTFHRKGSMQMPIDFIAILENGDTMRYHIPNTWFNKYANTPVTQGRLDRTYFQNTIVLPKWYGWDKLEDTYVAHIQTTQKIKNIIIDPSDRLADINKLDNSWKCPVEWVFDSHVWNYPSWDAYTMRWRPDIWGNAYDGLKVGLHLNGDYFNYKHKIEFTAWYNTGLLQGLLYDNTFVADDVDVQDDFDLVNFDFNYKTSTDKFLPLSDYFLNTGYLDGVFSFETGFEKKLGDGNRDLLRVYVKDLYFNNTEYLMYGDYVQEAKNNSVNIDYTRNYKYFTGSGQIGVRFRSNDLLSDYNFTRLQLEAINKTKLWKLDLRTRYFAQWGGGNNMPFESALLLAGGNTEEMLANKYTRSRGFFPDTWTGYGDQTNHFHMSGGLNLRGYAGYLAPETDDLGNQYLTYAGMSGTSVNVELQFNRVFNKSLISFIKMEPYLFADAGVLVTDAEFDAVGSLRMDAGIGSAFSWFGFGPLDEIQPITVRVDLPLFLNRPPFVDGEYFAFRYVIGVTRAF